MKTQFALPMLIFLLVVYGCFVTLFAEEKDVIFGSEFDQINGFVLGGISGYKFAYKDKFSIGFESFESDGLKIDDQVIFDAGDGDFRNPSIAPLPDDRIVIGYVNVLYNCYYVTFQILEPSGEITQGLEQCNSDFNIVSSNPLINSDSLGNIILGWQTKNQDGDGFGIYARRFGSDGFPLGEEFRVNTTWEGDQSNFDYHR